MGATVFLSSKKSVYPITVAVKNCTSIGVANTVFYSSKLAPSIEQNNGSPRFLYIFASQNHVDFSNRTLSMSLLYALGVFIG